MTGPLAGLRVIELAAVGPGPYAAMILADLGADVVRVEFLRGLDLDGEDLPPQRDPGGYPVLANRFEEVFATRTRDERTAVFAELDACTTPVLCWHEVPRHPHLAERQSIVTANGTTQVAPAPRFSRTPAELPPPMADPVDIDEVLAGWSALPDGASSARRPGCFV